MNESMLGYYCQRCHAPGCDAYHVLCDDCYRRLCRRMTAKRERNWAAGDEASPLQENAIRILEDMQ